MNPALAPTRPPRRQRGVGLFDALVALAILSFGMLAMTRFQGRMVAQATDSQSRQIANQFASELLSTVLVDAVNAACYTLPQQGTCNNSAAITRTTDWASRTAAALPGPVTTTSTLSSTGQLTLKINWNSKAPTDVETADATRTLTATTDVRTN
jgi:type IV pilus assembly protein PilV